MKKSFLLKSIVLAALSVAAVSANAYQSEVGLTGVYANTTGSDGKGIALDATYYFAGVDTAKGPLNEAAFLNRASNVGAAVSYAEAGDADATSAELKGEYYHADSNLYASANLGYGEIDDGTGKVDATTYAVELGYLPVDGLLLALGVTGVDLDVAGADTDFNPTLRAHYVTQYGSHDVALKADTTFADGNMDYNVGGTYYIDNTFGLGVDYANSNMEGADSTITFSAKKFVTPAASIEAMIGTTDGANSFGIRGAYRF